MKTLLDINGEPVKTGSLVKRPHGPLHKRRSPWLVLGACKGYFEDDLILLGGGHVTHSVAARMVEVIAHPGKKNEKC